MSSRVGAVFPLGRRTVIFSIGILLLLSLSRDICARSPQRTIAFVDVSVIPMDHEQVLPGLTVVVAGGRIVQVGPMGSTRLPPGSSKVDGHGDYLMPGLADMHVHLIRSLDAVKSRTASSAQGTSHTIAPLSASDDHERENRALGLLYVSNGVTTVRNMWGDSAVDTFDAEVESDQVLGPHVYSTGPITDGSPYTWEGSRLVDTEPQATAAVEQDVQAHRVALKVYNNLSADAYHWLVAAARAQGLPIVGHVPDAVGLRGVIDARQDSIEHLDGFLEALQPDPKSATNARTRDLLDKADMGKLPALVNAIRAANIWNCPTLVLDKSVSNDAEWQRKLGFVPPALMQRYLRGMPQWSAHPEVVQRLYDFHLAVVRALHEIGARLLLGTDAPKPTVLPGLSLPDELEIFVQAGLTPYEALRAGTSDAAVFLHQESEFGTVALGRRADLLLLTANPLENVNNVHKLAGVMVAGRWLRETELQRRLRDLRTGYKHAARGE